MKMRPSTLKTIALSAAFLYFAGMAVPTFIPNAHALYWEDDYDGNDPKERIQRPANFFLFDWINKLVRKSKQRQYGKIENRDNGPGVNNRPKATLVISCGIVGLGAGLLIGRFATHDEENRTSNMFIGGALGLGAGILTAALIMPHDYQVDPTAQADHLRYQLAWLQDDSSMTVRSAFHPTALAVKARF